jgi:hypothetical protein
MGERFAVPSVHGPEVPCALQDLRQHAGGDRRQVQDDEDGCTQVPGEGPDDGAERLNTPGRRADHDDVACGRFSPRFHYASPFRCRP